LEVLASVGSALLVYSVLRTRILRLRLFNDVASALLLIFNAAIAVWPMVRSALGSQSRTGGPTLTLWSPHPSDRRPRSAVRELVKSS
jgi:hypothetical protein